jgi:hypothetical protein
MRSQSSIFWQIAFALALVALFYTLTSYALWYFMNYR